MKTFKSVVNNKTFTLTENFSDMDQQVLFDLADNMLREFSSPVLMNSEVEFILSMEHQIHDHDLLPFTSEDITNNEPTANLLTLEGWEDLTESQRDELLEEYQEKLEDLDEDSEEWVKLDEIIYGLSDVEFEDYPEIMQWFMMDDRILYRLDEMGQCVLDNKYWGRQAFGQSITMDHCIMKVCYDIAMQWATEVK